MQKLSWPRHLGGRFKVVGAKQYPHSSKVQEYRRSYVTVEKLASSHDRIPMADYAELDFMRSKPLDLTYHLNWILLFTFFALSFFFMVPGLVFAAGLCAILENYFYLQDLLYLVRIPFTWTRPSSDERTGLLQTEPKTPSVAGPSKSYNLALPIISVPFALIYYAKIVSPWFPSLVHHVLFFVAVEHCLVLLHWSISELTLSIDRNILEQALRTEDSFSRALKKESQAIKQREEAEQRLALAVKSEEEKWKDLMDKKISEADTLMKQGANDITTITKQLELTTSQLRSHWFRPKHLKENLSFTIYWSIEQYLLSRRMEMLAHTASTPLCEENNGLLSKYYLPKCSSP